MAVTANQQMNMDVPTQQSFVRFFKNLPEKPSSTIRFFNRSDYYTLHGSDALFAAQEVFKTTSVCKKIGAEPNKIDGVVLNKNHFENFIRDLLLVKKYRVEVYVNQGSSKSHQDWILEYKGSPGNLSQFEDLLFSNAEMTVGVAVMAVKFSGDGGMKQVGVSCIDTTAGTISVSEFKDDDSFTDLEALVITQSPKECILVQQSDNSDSQKIKEVMERNNVLVTLRKKSEFSTDNIVQDLNSLIRFGKGQQVNAQALPETNLKSAMAATAALIKYLDLTSEEGYSGLFSLKEIERSRYVRLDSAAIKALNIEPRPESTTVGGVASSILTLLDKCKTPEGRRLLAQWIRQPLRDLALIKERHDIVGVLVEDSDLRSSLADDHLRRIPDLQQLAKKMSRKKAGLQDLYKIYLCVNHLPVVLEKLTQSSNAAFKAMFTDPLKELLEDMDKFSQMVEQTIDLEAADKGDFLVRPDFDDELKALNKVMAQKEEKIKGLLGKAASDLDLEAGKSIKLESNQQYGYHFRITLKEEKNIRNHKSYTILDSIKGGVRFRNKKMEDLNDEYMAARNTYTTQQKAVVDEIMITAAGYVIPIKSLGDVIAILDVLTSFALSAVSAPQAYIRPEMRPSEDGVLHLVQARHPCLEIQVDTPYIANDVHCTKDSRFIIVTGPNMGGKSTYIRSIGVTVLMAHIGSFVPCSTATISLIDNILARIGADDSQIKGLSTFMAEMVETSAIIKNSTNNSLVIIDELGRGTSTYDGCGIAWSIAEYLAKESRPYALFATHFHEITKLAKEVPGVKNYHVTALVGDDKFTLLYKVEPGICDQSFGIHVAKMANFPQNVIDFAKRKQAELEDLQGIVFEGSDDPDKKSKIISEGEKLMAEFSVKCKALDKSMSIEDIKAKVAGFKKEILAHENPYIEALLSAT